MNDRYLCKLWSDACRKINGDMCANPMCGKPAHSVHHVIKRRYLVTRYDPQNGLPLCANCHRIADRNSEFAMRMLPDGSREYLADMGMYTLKDWLAIVQQSRAEFDKQCAQELREIING